MFKGNSYDINDKLRNSLFFYVTKEVIKAIF